MSGTQYDDPNREALGLAPIWSGAGDEVTPQVTEQEEEAPSEEAPSKRPAKK